MSTISSHPEVNSSSPGVDQFRQLFNIRFQELSREGISRAEAAAQALLYAKSHTSAVVSTTSASVENKTPNEPEAATANASSKYPNEILSQRESTLSTINTAATSDLTIENRKTPRPKDETLYNRDIAYFTELRESKKDSFDPLITRFFSDPENLIHNFSCINTTKNEKQRDEDIVVEEFNNFQLLINIDLFQINAFYEFLQQIDHETFDFFVVVVPGLENLTEALNVQITSYRKKSMKEFDWDNCNDGNVLKPFICFLEFPWLQDPRCVPVLSRFLIVLNRLPVTLKNRLLHWMTISLTQEKFITYLSTIQQFLTLQLCQGVIQESKVGAKVLSWLFAIRSYFPAVSPKEFYNDELNTDYIQSREGRIAEFSLWMQDRQRRDVRRRVSVASVESSSSSVLVPPSGHDVAESSESASSIIATATEAEEIQKPLFSDVVKNSPSSRRKNHRLSSHVLQVLDDTSPCVLNCKSFISYPFLLTPATKATILELDANIQMRREMDQMIQFAMLMNQSSVIPYLVIRISRANIVQETINQISMYNTESEFRKPLKVIFDDEEGVDAGGVRKEFFQIMMRKLLDPQSEYGMFKYYETSRLLWFNPECVEFNPDAVAEFELIGLLVGIAIYNSVILDFKMPKVIYKKLKGDKCELSDLEELEPALVKGLKQMLEYPGEVSSDVAFMDLTFQVSYVGMFGDLRTVELKPGGSDISVSNENRQEYIDLYVDHILSHSVRLPFEAFAKGFKRVCGGWALDMFESYELELLICGNAALDLQDLQRGTRYEDGFTSQSPTIADFWTCVYELNDLEKKQFLQFISGSDRSPIDGLSALEFVISRNGSDDSRLPSAHTCFNHLLLPEYSSIDVLRQKLHYAIAHAEGFGLR